MQNQGRTVFCLLEENITKKKLHQMKVMVLRAVSTAMFKIFMQNTKISHIFISVLK